MKNREQKLELTLARLTLRPQEGFSSPATFPNKTFAFPANDRKLEAISLKRDDEGGGVTLFARFDGVERQITVQTGNLDEGEDGVWAIVSRTAGRRKWRLDRERHLQGQALFLRNAVHHHGGLEVRRGSVALRRPVKRRLWVD